MGRLSRLIGRTFRRLRGVREDWVLIPNDLDWWNLAPEARASYGQGFANDSEFALHYSNGWGDGWQLEVFHNGRVLLAIGETYWYRDGPERWTHRYHSKVQMRRLDALRDLEKRYEPRKQQDHFQILGDDLPCGIMRCHSSGRDWQVHLEPPQHWLETPELKTLKQLWSAMLDCAPIRLECGFVGFVVYQEASGEPSGVQE